MAKPTQKPPNMVTTRIKIPRVVYEKICEMAHQETRTIQDQVRKYLSDAVGVHPISRKQAREQAREQAWAAHDASLAEAMREQAREQS